VASSTPVRPVVSLIVTSYNQPNASALVLDGMLTQTRPVDELVVADDGSEPDTAALVDEFEARAPFPVIFTSQEDAGFRKARAINNAIRASAGQFVLFRGSDRAAYPERGIRNYGDRGSTRGTGVGQP